MLRRGGELTLAHTGADRRCKRKDGKIVEGDVQIDQRGVDMKKAWGD